MSEMGEIKVLGGTASPFVNRVQFVLNLKSIKYEFMEEDFDNKSELLLTSNPVFKRVPVLIHSNKPPVDRSEQLNQEDGFIPTFKTIKFKSTSRIRLKRQ
ncbi:hypothetical protein LXL04_038121 [Taraxacum kok-saghyz]